MASTAARARVLPTARRPPSPRRHRAPRRAARPSPSRRCGDRRGAALGSVQARLGRCCGSWRAALGWPAANPAALCLASLTLVRFCIGYHLPLPSFSLPATRGTLTTTWLAWTCLPPSLRATMRWSAGAGPRRRLFRSGPRCAPLLAMPACCARRLLPLLLLPRLRRQARRCAQPGCTPLHCSRLAHIQLLLPCAPTRRRAGRCAAK